MHTYVLIPLVATLGAGAMMSAILSRDPRARKSRVAAALLGCSAIWALCDLVAHIGFGADVAVVLFRVACSAVMFLPPLGIQLMLESDEGSMRRFRPPLIAAWFTSGVASLLSLLTPGFVSGVVWSPWGWRAQLGDLYAIGAIPGVVCIVTAFLCFRSQDRTPGEFKMAGRRWYVSIATFLLLAIPMSEIIAPYLEVSAPRLGAISVILLAGMLWGHSLRSGEYLPPPSRFAREVFDGLGDGVALVSREGRIRVANAALGQMVGIPVKDLRGQRVAELMQASIESLDAQGTDAETVLRGLKGNTIPVSVTTSELYDQDGSTSGSVLMIRDQREVAELRRRVVTAGRVAAVGELAAGIAHEVNNPIAFVQSNLHSLHKNDAAVMSLLKNELEGKEVPASLLEAHHLIGQSLQGISRVATIVKEVRGFSHMGPSGYQSNDINDLLESAVRMAIPRLRHLAEVTRFYGELDLVYCAGQAMKQVFLDLILNAARSFKGSGTLRLQTSMVAGDVVVIVEDDGMGMTKAQLSQIFDPVFGREVGDSGPDLCVVYQIVRQHEGSIEIDSEVGVGTMVTLTLPSEKSTKLQLTERTTSEPSLDSVGDKA